MKTLASKEKSRILQMVREMAIASPALLSALGVKGLEPLNDSEMDEEDGDS